jgi:hypothetical protein
MARVCYVILAHNEPANLIGVLGSLWNRSDAFSIWVDAKSDPEFVQLANGLTRVGGNLQIHMGRVMSWGGFSIVDTTLMAYSSLRDQVGDFSHVILCSGTHVPLLHPDGIYERIRDCAGWMDVCACKIPEAGLRVRDNLPPGWVGDILMRVRYRYAEFPGVGMLPTEERQNWIAPTLLEGSQWHVLRSDLVDFIVEHESEIHHNFRDVLVPDEHAFQWIVSRSPRFQELRRGDHVFMRWEGASPKRLSFSEAAEIAAQGQFLFARKAHAGCAVDDWIAWTRDRLANAGGARWLQGASLALQSAASEPGAHGVVTSEELCNRLLGTLQVELFTTLGTHTKLEERSKGRWLIDSGRRHSSGGRLFFLCFAAEPSLGISVVPALRQGDLVDDNPIYSQPRVHLFSEFVNLPIGGRVGWSIGPTDTLTNCKQFANIISTALR